MPLPRWRARGTRTRAERRVTSRRGCRSVLRGDALGGSRGTGVRLRLGPWAEQPEEARGAGGRGVALSRSELGPVRGPGCPASRVRGKRAPRRGVPGRGTSLLRTCPHPGSLPKAEAQTFARLRGNSEPPRALPLPPPWVFTPPSGCSDPHLPPSPCARMRVCVCARARAREAGKGAEVQRLLLASPLPLPPPGYQWGVPRLSTWPGRLQTRPGDSGR